MSERGADPAALYQSLYRSGVGDVVAVANRIEDAAWERPACGQWTATETAHHLLAVTDWYHAWLERSLRGELDPPFQVGEMDRQNELAKAAYTTLDGPSAITAFAERADQYLAAASPHWDRSFAFPYGVVTVGAHVGVGASEWQVHAWDLSTVTDTRHVPEDPAAVFAAVAAGLAMAQGGIRGSVTAAVLPVVTMYKPWESLLRRSGRTP
ncbi:MAG: maleylpyruvate isomerase N-terminal domain-containing protein [Acidobacteria bacterium]|nr:maleylpyruvate isomerase N-terminal domain-containing protein [Acidobacteriota bacterium]